MRLRPAQERQLTRWLYHLTGAWNWAVRKIELDANDGRYWTAYDLKAAVGNHAVRVGVPSDSLEGVVAEAAEAWRRCFKGISRRPRLKGQRNRLNAIAFPHGRDFKPSGGRINIPRLGRVRYHKQEIPDGRIGYGRIVKRASGWYACLFIKAAPAKIQALSDGQIGIDPGYINLITISTGEVVEHPQELNRSALRLAQAQRGGRKRLAARIHERVSNRRKDRNHKLSRRLVSENAVIVWSKDRIDGIKRMFGKSATSAGHRQLRSMLAYKCRAGGREFIEVGSRHSTMTCSACGARTGPTGYAGLSVRRWACSACGAAHDRDVNAAINTLRAGLGTSLERGREAASGIA